MQTLEQLVTQHQARIRPADTSSIDRLEQQLGFPLAAEYRAFLSTFGIIVHGAYEIYGLGVPDDYYLNVHNAYTDLSQDPTYPNHAVPLMDTGDGHYYLYDNQACHILLWATPNGGVMQTLDEGLDTFIAKRVFGD